MMILLCLIFYHHHHQHHPKNSQWYRKINFYYLDHIDHHHHHSRNNQKMNIGDDGDDCFKYHLDIIICIEIKKENKIIIRDSISMPRLRRKQCHYFPPPSLVLVSEE